jgi:hypothetical protein
MDYSSAKSYANKMKGLFGLKYRIKKVKMVIIEEHDER